MGAGGCQESKFFECPLFLVSAKSEEVKQGPGDPPKEAANRPGVSFLLSPGKLFVDTAARPAFLTPRGNSGPSVGFAEAATASSQRSPQRQEAGLVILTFSTPAGPGHHSPGLQRGAVHGPPRASSHRKPSADKWFSHVEVARMFQ